MMRGINEKEKKAERTHHSEVAGGRGWGQQAIGGHAGVVSRILWDETGDEKRSIYHDLDAWLQQP